MNSKSRKINEQKVSTNSFVSVNVTSIVVSGTAAKPA